MEIQETTSTKMGNEDILRERATLELIKPMIWQRQKDKREKRIPADGTRLLLFGEFRGSGRKSRWDTGTKQGKIRGGGEEWREE